MAAKDWYRLLQTITLRKLCLATMHHATLVKVEQCDEEFHNIYSYVYANNIPKSASFKSWMTRPGQSEELIEDDLLTYTIESLQPDVVFLDIEMPVMNGFLMLQQLKYKNFELIFVTAYDHYAIKAIRYSALDYLVKPVEISELKTAVSRAESNRINHQSQTQIELLLEHFHKKQPRRITIPTSNGLQFINLEDIIYFEASNNYTNIYLSTNEKLLVSRTLKDFEEMLPAETFLRIHHSIIVNKFYVEKYIRGDGGQVVMSNGVLLDVSKRKKSEFLQAIGY